MSEERVLVYAGPSLDTESILEQVPEAIICPPVRQGDFVSDCMYYEPSHVLIIDGEFHQSLSVWHKEVVWALQVPGVKGVYGASSMGALRAADLEFCGMIGCGRIFNWYNEGVITEEAEVACVYGSFGYASMTVPLVNIRGALLKAIESETLTPEDADKYFELAQEVHWTERYPNKLHPVLADLLTRHNQKAIDALELICTFRDLKPAEGFVRPTEEALSKLFTAQFERDRKVTVGGQKLRLQDLDAFITLHDQEYEQHAQDADNRTLALLLADIYRIYANDVDMSREWFSWNTRRGIRNAEDHAKWMKENHINEKELNRLLVEEARLRKLRRALMIRSGPRRRTQRMLDYMKLSSQYVYWTRAAARHEQNLTEAGGEQMLEFGKQVDVFNLLLQHARKSGQTISLELKDYVREMGFGTIRELLVALSRDNLGISGEQFSSE